MVCRDSRAGPAAAVATGPSSLVGIGGPWRWVARTGGRAELLVKFDVQEVALDAAGRLVQVRPMLARLGVLAETPKVADAAQLLWVNLGLRLPRVALGGGVGVRARDVARVRLPLAFALGLLAVALAFAFVFVLA